MQFLDIILIVLLAAALVSGIKRGFVYKIGTFVGLLLGIWFASRWTPFVTELFGGSVVMTIIVFLFILSLVSKLFGIVAWFIDKVFKIVALIPFLTTFNRVLGGILGVVTMSFILSATLYLAEAVSSAENVQQSAEQLEQDNSISSVIHDSQTAQALLQLSVFYEPLLSEKLNDILEAKDDDEKDEDGESDSNVKEEKEVEKGKNKQE